MSLMGREEKGEEAGPEAAYDVSNTWSAMSLSGHIGSALRLSVALLTSKCILGRANPFLVQTKIAADQSYAKLLLKTVCGKYLYLS